MNRDITDITVVVTIDPSAGLADATRTLVGLRGQSLRPLAVIVAFAGDEDASVVDAVSAWADRQCSEGFDIRVLPGCFGGVVEARNAALREVSTGYVAFLNAGDEPLPEHFEAMSRELCHAAAGADLLWHDVALRDADGWTSPVSARSSDPLVAHLLDDALQSPRFLVSTELLRSVGGYDERLHGGAGLELGCRLLGSAAVVTRVNAAPTIIVPSVAASDPDAADMALTLDACRLALSRRDDPESALTWLRARSMIESGRLARAGLKDAAARLSDATLQSAPGAAQRIRLGFVRDTQAYFGAGAAALARFFFTPSRKSSGNPS